MKKKIKVLLSMCLANSVLLSCAFLPAKAFASGKDAAEKLAAIRSLIDEAANGSNPNVTYILSGDSTRDSKNAGQEFIYREHLKQINVKYVHNSRSGLRAYQWVRNTVPVSSLKKAIDNTSGDGSNTIMEFSLGINDLNGYGAKKAKQNIIDSLKAYLDAKPKAHVVLVVPVSHKTSFQAKWLPFYKEIAQMFKLPLLNQERVLKTAFNDPHNRYYYDNVHPAFFGATRLTRYILDSISGPAAKKKMIWENDYFTGSKDQDASINLAADKKISPKTWYWPHNKSSVIAGGKKLRHPNLSTIEPIAVEGNSLIQVSGARIYGISLIDNAGKLVYTFSPSIWKKHNIVYCYIPSGIKTLKVTFKGDKAPVMNYLNTGELAALTANDIYWKNPTKTP